MPPNLLIMFMLVLYWILGVGAIVFMLFVVRSPITLAVLAR